ncbi:MAG: hypothetical protein HUU55_20125 [Myxococcales bacterium]|nr:hypothetical protein [Myxococcales bacterium]
MMKWTTYVGIVLGIGILYSDAMAKPTKSAKPAKTSGLTLFTTPGTEWSFEVTMSEPGKPNDVHIELWRIAEIKPVGSIQRIFVVVTEEGQDGLRDTQIEYASDGTKFHDLAWLTRARPAATFDADMLKERLPLFDTSAAKAEAIVTRYPDNPLAYVRYQLLKEFKAKNGKTYNDVIWATRNRGDTEPTDEWWYSSREGIVQIYTKIPEIGGGGEVTWARTDKRPTPRNTDDSE